MVIMLDLAPDLGQSAQRALSRSDALAGIDLVDAEDGLAGYSWYDTIPKVSGLAFRVEAGEQTYAFDDLSNPSDRPPEGRVDRITLAVAFEADALPALTVADDALIFNDEANWDIDRAVPYVTRDATISVGDLADLIVRASFLDSTDSDADGYYTQHADFSRDARNLATTLLLGNEQALLTRIEELLGKEITFLIPENRSVTVALARHGATATFA